MGALSKFLGGRPTRASQVGPHPGGRPIVAAAIPLTEPEGRAAWNARSNNVAWQQEAWRMYDTVGEVRFAFNWLANAISRADMFAAPEDQETGKLGDPTEDVRVQRVVAGILGGHKQRPQLLQTMALHWLVSGETYVLIRPTDDPEAPDEWIVLPAQKIQVQGDRWSYTDPVTMAKTAIRPGTDMLIRIWSPHPFEQSQSDSSMRAALPILQEIEKTSQNIAARLDSRLSGNGILIMPQGMSFPSKDGTSSAFVADMIKAASIGIEQPGSAAAQVPIMLQVPDELVGSIQHLDLVTEFEAGVVELRETGIQRLGRALDMPKEVALSQTGDSNHWSAWQVEEMTYKIHIEPLLRMFGSAITSGYLAPVLATMGVTEPMVIDWDISEVTAAPDRSEDLKYLYEHQLISDDYMRSQFGIPDDAIPSDKERQYQLAVRMLEGAPTLLENESIADTVGFEATPVQDSGVVDVSRETEPGRAIPERASEPDDGLVAAAELVVFDALSRAGGRLLTREYRGRFGSVDKWALHTVIPHDEADLPRLMEGSFQFTDNIARAWNRDPADLTERLRTYVTHCLRGKMAHSSERLGTYL